MISADSYWASEPLYSSHIFPREKWGIKDTWLTSSFVPIFDNYKKVLIFKKKGHFDVILH